MTTDSEVSILLSQARMKIEEASSKAGYPDLQVGSLRDAIESLQKAIRALGR